MWTHIYMHATYTQTHKSLRFFISNELHIGWVKHKELGNQMWKKSLENRAFLFNILSIINLQQTLCLMYFAAYNLHAIKRIHLKCIILTNITTSSHSQENLMRIMEEIPQGVLSSCHNSPLFPPLSCACSHMVLSITWLFNHLERSSASFSRRQC